MKSNSNLTITDYKVDPASQQISEVYINGEKLETGSPVTVEDNKTATINVSTYTSPVEITPTSGNDAMAKATVTLSNIPSVPTSMKMVTLQKISSSATTNGVIVNSNIADSSSFHDISTVTFFGKFYTISETGVLSDTSYTLETGPCGSTVVRIGSSYYDKIKLGWD